MNFALVYLVGRFFWRIGDFFHHWYVHGTRNLADYFMSLLERIDRTLALKVTLRHFFEPLYKDYTVVGRILGVFFRFFRVLTGVLVYGFVGLVVLLLYLTWLMLPPLILFKIFRSF